jgi:hypothetical protein
MIASNFIAIYMFIALLQYNCVSLVPLKLFQIEERSAEVFKSVNVTGNKIIAKWSYNVVLFVTCELIYTTYLAT